NLKIYYFDSELNGQSSTDMALWRYDGADWNWRGGIFTENGDYDNVTVEYIDTFSKWTVSDTITSPLPITLLSFDAFLENDEVLINWSTGTETGNDYFYIERSTGGLNWDVMETVVSDGNSSNLRNYSAIDPNPETGLSYYRLKQTDLDGDFTYSASKAIQIIEEANSKLFIFPNPTNDYIAVFGTSLIYENIRIYDMLGREVTNQTTFVEENDQKVIIDLSNLAKGMYYVKTSNGGSKILKE
ncbi:MAG: T9SS type A sorting domain-containing protein, partial [Flavobacteriales bacterium]|nr:T9SS type A sorting domain-containing protein [Flavobacteriales bacterium]